jgi:hypothetical protein
VGVLVASGGALTRRSSVGVASCTGKFTGALQATNAAIENVMRKERRCMSAGYSMLVMAMAFEYPLKLELEMVRVYQLL